MIGILLRKHPDRPLDRAGTDAAVGLGIAAEHDAVGLGAVEPLGFVGGARCPPWARYGASSKAARRPSKWLVGGEGDYLEEVLAEVGLVQEADAAAGPVPLPPQAVEADVLLFRDAAVEVIEAQGAAREPGIESRVGRGMDRGGQGQDEAEEVDRHGEISL